MYSTIMNIYVVVTFLYPKTKEKQKLPEIKINDLQHKHYKVYHTISSQEAKKS